MICVTERTVTISQFLQSYPKHKNEHCLSGILDSAIRSRSVEHRKLIEIKSRERKIRRSYLVPTHSVPTPLVKLLLNYLFYPNKSKVILEIFVFFDKSV